MPKALLRILLMAAVSMLAGMPAPAQNPLTLAQTPVANAPYEPLSVGAKGRVFGSRIVSPVSIGKSAFTAGLNQLQDKPEEWGQGMAGYGRRFAHKMGTRAAENGIGFLAAASLKQDPRFFRSDESGFWRRSRYALVNTVLTRTDDGGRAPAYWRFAGNYGSEFVSNAWRPDRQTNFSDTMIRSTVSVGYDAASNLIKEFWPDIRKIFKRSE